MSQFTHETKQRANKLNGLVTELEQIDRFRHSMKTNKLTGLKVTSSTPNGSNPVTIELKESFPHLNDMFEAMIDASFFKRQDEIKQVLREEYGGAYPVVKTSSRE